MSYGNSGFKKFLYGLNGVIISLFALFCVFYGGFTVLVGFENSSMLDNLLVLAENIFPIINVLWIGYFCLSIVQVVMMVGVFIFQITRLGEYVKYYVGAILSLVTYPVMITFMFIVLGYFNHLFGS